MHDAHYTRSGRLTIGTLIAFNVIILLAAGFFGISLYLLSKAENLAMDEQNQTLSELQQRQILSLTDNVSSLRKELGVEKTTSDLTTAALNKKLSDAQAQSEAAAAQNQKNAAQTQQKLSSLEQGVNAIKTYNTADIISEWRPRIAHIECSWNNASGAPYQAQSGSGIVAREKNGTSSVVTNTHVVVDEFGVPPTLCKIQLPDYNVTTTITASQISKSAAGYDWSRIDLAAGDAHIDSLAAKPFALCAETPSVGTHVVILGYPGIGSQTDITATEGIISGYDGDYYITSAKVDFGNSGGAAIALQKDCYLGIPTFTKTGGLESLARILSSHLIFP